MTCTKPRAVPIIAYRDWLKNPTREANIFPKSVRIRWYKIIASTPTNKNIAGPQTKF
jgi:hypothetical protein